MDINKNDLDNYITGHYGEDQCRDNCDGPTEGGLCCYQNEPDCDYFKNGMCLRGLTAKEILITGLKQIGADGLCSCDFDCGCGFEDFVPCNCNFEQCIPARRIPVPVDHEDFGYIDWLYEPIWRDLL